MQATRQLILEYLKEHGPTTVDQLADVLDLTSVTVRHHLDILRGEGLVGDPLVQHRVARGRPQHVYNLTDKASSHFPKNYSGLADKLLTVVKNQNPKWANVVFEGLAEEFLKEAPCIATNATLPERLRQAVEFLNERGYVATYERTPDGYLLHTHNCPYDAIVTEHPELCQMDMTLVCNLIGRVPERLNRVADGAVSCAYLFREPATRAIK